MGTPSLPPELWILIASDPCLFKADLARLCAASSHLLNVVRPLLYRAVHLEAVDYEFSSAETLVLLAKDKSLAKCVVELTISRRLKSDHCLNYLQNLPCLVHVDALANMISLKHITLSDHIFRNAVEQSEFARALACIPLEQFSYLGSGPLGQFAFGASNTGPPGDQFEGIGNLKKLVWVDNRGFSLFFH